MIHYVPFQSRCTQDVGLASRAAWSQALVAGPEPEEILFPKYSNVMLWISYSLAPPTWSFSLKELGRTPSQAQVSEVQRGLLSYFKVQLATSLFVILRARLWHGTSQATVTVTARASGAYSLESQPLWYLRDRLGIWPHSEYPYYEFLPFLISRDIPGISDDFTSLDLKRYPKVRKDRPGISLPVFGYLRYLGNAGMAHPYYDSIVYPWLSLAYPCLNIFGLANAATDTKCSQISPRINEMHQELCAQANRSSCASRSFLASAALRRLCRRRGLGRGSRRRCVLPAPPPPSADWVGDGSRWAWRRSCCWVQAEEDRCCGEIWALSASKHHWLVSYRNTVTPHINVTAAPSTGCKSLR